MIRTLATFALGALVGFAFGLGWYVVWLVKVRIGADRLGYRFWSYLSAALGDQ